jgi:hypothetical protein
MLATTICQPSNEIPHSVVTCLIFTWVPKHCNLGLHVLTTYKDAFPIGIENLCKLGKMDFMTRWHYQGHSQIETWQGRSKMKAFMGVAYMVILLATITIFSMPIG